VVQVLDASVAVAWCATNQATPLTRAALVQVIAHGAVVPSSFWHEVFHGLTRLTRRGIVRQDDIEMFIDDVSDLNFSVDPARETDEMIELYRLSQHNSLTIYDAGYLELAMRSGLSLATNDQALASAARSNGVILFAP
jgi:predicted nucleic acid-binding protein